MKTSSARWPLCSEGNYINLSQNCWFGKSTTLETNRQTVCPCYVTACSTFFCLSGSWSPWLLDHLLLLLGTVTVLVVQFTLFMCNTSLLPCTPEATVCLGNRGSRVVWDRKFGDGTCQSVYSGLRHTCCFTSWRRPWKCMENRSPLSWPPVPPPRMVIALIVVCPFGFFTVTEPRFQFIFVRPLSSSHC